MELMKLNSFEELPNIEITDVEKTNFSTYANTCLSLLLSDAEKRSDTIECNLYNFLNENETYINKIIQFYRSLTTCLEMINLAVNFVSFYNKNDYTSEKSIPFDKFALYHYDVICHKVSTIKDLYFKIINGVYNLNLNKCNWESINNKKEVINNPLLFDLLNTNHNLLSSITSKRNKSSHEGIIQSAQLADIALYLQMSDLLYSMPQLGLSNKTYSKNSQTYEFKIEKAKLNFVNDLKVIRYNTFAVSKCLLCELSDDFLKIITKKLPRMEKRIKEIIASNSPKI